MRAQAHADHERTGADNRLAANEDNDALRPVPAPRYSGIRKWHGQVYRALQRSRFGALPNGKTGRRAGPQAVANRAELARAAAQPLIAGRVTPTQSLQTTHQQNEPAAAHRRSSVPGRRIYQSNGYRCPQPSAVRRAVRRGPEDGARSSVRATACSYSGTRKTPCHPRRG